MYAVKDGIEVFSTTTFNQKDAIKEAEVGNALKEISNGKSPGIDNLPVGLKKATGKEGTKIVSILCKINMENVSVAYRPKKDAYTFLSAKKKAFGNLPTTEQSL